MHTWWTDCVDETAANCWWHWAAFAVRSVFLTVWGCVVYANMRRLTDLTLTNDVLREGKHYAKICEMIIEFT